MNEGTGAGLDGTVQDVGAGLDGMVQDVNETVTYPGDFGNSDSCQAKNKTKDDEAKNEKETDGGKNLQGMGAGLDGTVQGVGAGRDEEVQNGKETVTHGSKNSRLGRAVFKNMRHKYSVLKNIRLKYLVSKNTRLDFPVYKDRIGDTHQAKNKATDGDNESTGDDLHQTDDMLEAMGVGQDTANETVTNVGNFHQDGYRAGEETEGGKDRHGKNEIEAEKG